MIWFNKEIFFIIRYWFCFLLFYLFILKKDIHVCTQNMKFIVFLVSEQHHL